MLQVGAEHRLGKSQLNVLEPEFKEVFFNIRDEFDCRFLNVEKRDQYIFLDRIQIKTTVLSSDGFSSRVDRKNRNFGEVFGYRSGLFREIHGFVINNQFFEDEGHRWLRRK